eukprot:447640_1
MVSNHSKASHVLIAVVILLLSYKLVYNKKPKLNKSHEYIVLTDLISSSEEHSFRQYFEYLDQFPRAKSDFSSKIYTNIGEAYDPDSNGICNKSLTTKHPTLNKCVFIPRMDVLPHHILTGGYEGFKESTTTIISRLQLFIKHEFNAYNKTQFKPLFESKPYVNAIQKVCGSDRPYIKPIELNLGVQLPGQGILSHHDAVYFKDATRQTHPLWLLQIMKVSHLFDDKLIPQIQGVVYIGENSKRGGEIYTYPNGIDSKPILIPPTPKSAVIMDGTEIIHGTVVYQPSRKPLTIIDHNSTFSLKFDHDQNVFRIYKNDVGMEYNYSWADIRASIAYRALCFENEMDMNSWNEYESDLSVDDIMKVFKNDLISKNVINQQKWDEMSKYDVGLLLANYYMQLPSTTLGWIPVNYYALIEYYCTNRVMYDSVFHQMIQKMLC